MIIEHYSKKYNYIKIPFKPLNSLLINSKKKKLGGKKTKVTLVERGESTLF